MKSLIYLSFSLLICAIYACGEDNKITSANASKNQSAKENKEYDCECETDILNWKLPMIKAKDKEKGEDYTGTCAIFSKDRAKRLIGLYHFKNGYRLKQETWYDDGKNKIKTSEKNWDDRDKCDGWGKGVSVNKELGVFFVSEYQEFKNSKEIYGWRIFDGFWNNDFMKDFSASLTIKDESGEKEHGLCEGIENYPFKTRHKEGFNDFIACIKSQNIKGFETGKIPD